MADFDDELLQELMNTFRVEAADHLHTLNHTLLELERDSAPGQRQPLIQDAFRAAHSLKGAARAVSMPDIEQLAHAMESILQLARDTSFVLTADVCDLFYDALDMIAALIEGQEVESDGLVANLQAVKDIDKPATPEQPTPTSAPVTPTPAQGASQVPADPIPAPANPVDETIRVNVDKLDDLMAQVSELLISKISAEHRLVNAQDVRHYLGQLAKIDREAQTLIHHSDPRFAEYLERQSDVVQKLTQAFNVLDRGIYQDTLRLGVATNGVQDQVRRLRMVPFQTITLVLERAVRDAARSEQKQVHFIVEGAQVELDKQVLQSLKDSLLHLLRNAVVHGIEPADIREGNGKPAAGTVTLSVQQRGSEVRIAVRDDGRGFDLERLRVAAQHNGHGVDTDALNIAFLPGISTAEFVTELSGRGVGLDVVRRQLETVQGRVMVENTPGRGAVVEMIVPTSLAMTRVLLVKANGEHYALPLLAVEKISELNERIIIGGKPMFKDDDTTLPLITLASILDRPYDELPPRPLVVIMGVAEQRIALVVDDVLTEQELAVKALLKPLIRVRNVSGAALMGNGDPIIVLNPVDMIRSTQYQDTAITVNGRNRQQANAAKEVVSVLVVDDSITTRTLEKNILEAAGFHVVTATDGLQAMQRLKQMPVDIVVSDIQMPNMDGFTLTQSIRDQDEYSTLPIILVTSLESPEDREHGMRAGADAYIVKRGFDQAELLATIQRLL